MTMTADRALSVLSLFGAMLIAGAACAEDRTPWIDPPAELSERPQAAGMKQPNDHRPAAPSVSRPEREPKARAGVKSAQKRAQSRARRERATQTARRPESSASRNRGAAARRPGYERIETVGEALERGLSVTTIRTIELPDGRHVDVVVAPDPRTRIDMVVPVRP
jgi:hypothetical protein